MKLSRYLKFNMLKASIFYSIFFGLSLSYGIANLHSAVLVDRIVAVVNDKIITLSELNYLLKPYAYRLKAMEHNPADEKKILYSLREKILNQLINDHLTNQKAEQFQLTVTEAEINAAIERIKKSNYHTDEDFRKILAQEGLTVEEYRNDLKEQILRARIVDYEVKSKVVITKEDIELYYKKNSEQYLGQKKYHLRNIIMRPSSFADEEDSPALLSKMQNLLTRFKQGESFYNLARLNTQSPFAEEGGDLGFFKLDDLAPAIQDALKGLKPGECTSVLDTEQGLQIFYIEAIDKIPGRSLEDTSEEIQKILYDEAIDKRFKVWIKNMRAKSHIKIIK